MLKQNISPEKRSTKHPMWLRGVNVFGRFLAPTRSSTEVPEGFRHCLQLGPHKGASSIQELQNSVALCKTSGAKPDVERDAVFEVQIPTLPEQLPPVYLFAQSQTHVQIS